MDRPSLNEQIDACRPGHNDPDDVLLREELAPLAEQITSDAATRQRYERSQQLDTAIAAAVHDVPVPEGLAERLLAAVPDGPSADPPADVAAVPAAAVEPLDQLAEDAPSPAQPRVRWWRRRSVLATAAAACLAIVATGITYWWLQPTPITVAMVQMEIQQQYDADVRLAKGWQAPGTARFPFPTDVRANQKRHRCRKATVWGYPADVHALLGPNAPVRATLFVIKRRVTGLPTSVRATNTNANLGDRVGTLGIWQDDEYVYVLAVESNPDVFHQFLKGAGTLAWLGTPGVATL